MQIRVSNFYFALQIWTHLQYVLHNYILCLKVVNLYWYKSNINVTVHCINIIRQLKIKITSKEDVTYFMKISYTSTHKY
jgi:hypothetical protein